MSLVKLVDRFGSDERCRDYLEELRWSEGVECPRCESDSISRITTRNQLDCNDCRYRFSLTTGTLFHDSHLPLSKWFMAIYLVTESKKGISAKQLQRMLDTSYKTAWYLGHRIRAAMGDDDQPLLRGIVEVDETFVGGRRYGVGRGNYRDADNPPVVGAVERGDGVERRFQRDEVFDDARRREALRLERLHEAAYVGPFYLSKPIAREEGDGVLLECAAIVAPARLGKPAVYAAGVRIEPLTSEVLEGRSGCGRPVAGSTPLSLRFASLGERTMKRLVLATPVSPDDHIPRASLVNPGVPGALHPPGRIISLRHR